MFSEALKDPEGLSEGPRGPRRGAEGLPGPRGPELRPEGPFNASGNTVHSAHIFLQARGLVQVMKCTFLNFG